MSNAVNVEQILLNAGFNPSPSWYAGRGNKRVDVDSDKLQKLFSQIAEHRGVEAGQIFVGLVRNSASTGDVSAATIIQSVLNAERFGWNNAADAAESYTTAHAAADAVRHGQDPLPVVMFALATGPQDSVASIAGKFLARYPQSQQPREIDFCQFENIPPALRQRLQRLHGQQNVDRIEHSR